MIPTDERPTKKQQQGEQSRELILDATERLMATRGYRGDVDQRHPQGVRPAAQLHLLAFRLQGGRARGGDGTRRRPVLRGDPDVEPTSKRQLAVVSSLQSQHPDFLAAVLHAVAGAQRRSRGRRGGAPGPRHRDRPVPRRDHPTAARRRRRRRRPNASSPNSPPWPSRCRTGCSSPSISNPTAPTSNGCTGGCSRR